jgi:hypothetical protein
MARRQGKDRGARPAALARNLVLQTPEKPFTVLHIGIM